MARIVATAALLAVSGAAGSSAYAAPTPACALTSERLLRVEFDGSAPPAAAILRGIASRLRTVPADSQIGAYAYIRVNMQAADSALDPPCPQTVTAYAQEQRWRADNGSGQVTGTPWHHDPAAPPAVETTVYAAGELAGVLNGPVPAAPSALAAALDANGHGVPTAARIRAVADLNGWHYLNRDARQAVLLFLADIDGITYRGAVTGYPGAIAVSADNDGWRELLVLDPRSGVVNAYEQILLRDGQQLGVRTPYSNARTAYLDRGRTPQPDRVPGPPRH
ncbi:hypothetical protein WEI85_00130 [Actinomycetes bacterium KLBMP 9797]